MKTLKLIASIIVAGASALTAFPYSAPGHEAIWILAHAQLVKINPTAAAKVDQILAGDTVAQAADWADWIRLKEVGAGKATWPEIKDVTKNAPFIGSNDWHFVDLPLGATAYSDTLTDAGADDVVHGIEKCVDLLEQPDSSPGKIVHHRALRFLIHLCGDIHQPLHVACGYYRTGANDEPDVITNPETIASEGLLHDRGGNQLQFGSSNLHHLWDADLPAHLPESGVLHDSGEIADFLTPELNKTPFWHTPGDYHHWPEAWATDSIKVSKLAYRSIKIREAIPDNDGEHTPTQIQKTKLIGFNKDDYIDGNRERAQKQMVKAAGRLADLLSAIQYAN